MDNDIVCSLCQLPSTDGNFIYRQTATGNGRGNQKSNK